MGVGRAICDECCRFRTSIARGGGMAHIYGANTRRFLVFIGSLGGSRYTGGATKEAGA